MPVRKPARIRTIPGRNGYYAYVSRNRPNVRLQGETEAEALQDLARLLSTPEGQDTGRPSGLGSTTLSDHATTEIEWAESSNSKRMAEDVRLDLVKRIVPFLDGKGITTAGQVERSHIEDYIVWRRATVGAKRVVRELNSFRRLMARACSVGDADALILDNFRGTRKGGLRPKEPQPTRTKRYLSRAEWDAVFAVLQTRYRDHARALVGSGMRVEELWHVTLDDLTPKSVTVSAKPRGACDCCPKGWNPKGYASRTIPITADTHAAFTGFLDGKAMLPRHKKNFWSAMTAACDAARVLRATPHDLRRTWATWLLDAGVKLGLVSRLLGHQQLVTTMLYLGVSIEDNTLQSLPI